MYLRESIAANSPEGKFLFRLGQNTFEWVLPGHGQKVHLPADEMRQQVERLAETMREG